MHGDGHGGVHHHDGFLNVNGIFEGRFDIILTNPPFGANVDPTEMITDEQVAVSGNEAQYIREFGSAYREAQSRLRAAKGKPISSLFELPKAGGEGQEPGKIKTEILFIERCLELLRPGGRLGIVLPEGVFNNPSLAYVRSFCEDRAYIRAVISLPQETFISSGASVKASLLFVEKFTEKAKAVFDRERASAESETRTRYKPEVDKETARLEAELLAAKKARDAEKCADLQRELRQYERSMEAKIAAESRVLLKERFDYPVFLYEAEHVGIDATGDTSVPNELYPNAKQPSGTEGKTCLDLYRAFLKDPKVFLKQGA
jgi:type I restriction enzyme M protein